MKSNVGRQAFPCAYATVSIKGQLKIVVLYDTVHQKNMYISQYKAIGLYRLMFSYRDYYDVYLPLFYYSVIVIASNNVLNFVNSYTLS